MQPRLRVRTLLALGLVLGVAAPGVCAADGPLVVDVPVPGGIAALAEAIGAGAPVDPVRFAGELPRILYDVGAHAEPRIAAAAAALRAGRNAAVRDLAPIPLPPSLWSEIVFRRPVAADDLVAAILSDRAAALLCRGLAGVDDETLAFLADHRALLRTLYEHSAPAFAAFADSIRIRGGAVVVPGGPPAASLWRGLLGIAPAAPEPFIRELFARGAGRIAYLYDTLAHLDAPRRAFALGATLPDNRQAERFAALAALATNSCPEWSVTTRPFGRPSADVGVLLREAAVEPDGRLAPPVGRRFWSRAFGGSGGGDEPADAAWLAGEVVNERVSEREQRIEQLAFAQRFFRFGGEAQAETGAGDSRKATLEADADVLESVSGYARFPMLLLTLERAGIQSPATYAQAVRAARTIGRGTSPARAAVALAQFQSALVVITRARDAGTLTAARADSLARGLFAIRLTDGEYRGGLARWIESSLLPAFDEVADGDADTKLESALSGPPPAAAQKITWEGQDYVVDLSTPERQRLRRVRDRQEAPRVADVLADGGRLPEASTSDARRVDQAMAAALRALVYAAFVGDPDGPALVAGDPSARHQFGADNGDGDLARAWVDPRDEVMPHVPRLVRGSLLNVDLALAPFALSRMDPGRVVRPSLNPNDRDVLAQSVALMNPRALKDDDLDAIAGALARGRSTVAAASAAELDVIAERLRMDGWTRRAIGWSAERSANPASFFSLADMLLLGDASAPARLHAWGTSVRALGRCVCTAFVAPAEWPLVMGRPQLGTIGAQLNDLQIAVAVGLHERRLPAALARGVLAAAMQDFIDDAQPADVGDWLSAVRGARAIEASRFDDYVAALTAGGPLVPAGRARRTGGR